MLLRKITIKDLPIRVEWMNNPKVFSSMHFEVPVLLENTFTWYEKNRTNQNRYDVCFEDNGRIIAFGGLTSIDNVLKKAELYIFVNPNVQCSGIGTEATKQLCKFAFSDFGLHKIFLITNEDNYAAIRVYQKCGFTLEGRLRDEYYTQDGGFKDRFYFGLLKEEFHE